ncbi:MAG: cation:proton antiporter [Euryarchaeota archaeon]|nr:cation:proton antiporter [Euryarchaeota archaeon]
MGLDVESFLLAVGIMMGAAFLALLAFRRYRLPDVLFLILLGVFLGPVSGLVEVSLFRAIGPLVGVVAIIIILFDGGLEMRFSHLRHGVLAGVVLAFVVFSLTAALCAVVAHFLGGYGLGPSVLLGMAFGGAGVVIVIPLIQRLGVRPESATIVSVEAAVSDVLVIVGIYALSTALAYGGMDAAGIGGGIAATFSLGIVGGLASGFVWARALGRGWFAGHDYVLTLAALFLLYVGIEWLSGSGPIAVLIFGLMVGNSKKTGTFTTERRIGRPNRRQETEQVPVFDEHLTGFHNEIVFLIRAFFFVGLGVTLDLDVFRSVRFIALGVLLTACVGFARWLSVQFFIKRDQYPAWDRLAVSLMFPLGLAAAVLSQVPHQRFGIAGTEDFAAIAAVVIVLTNLSTTVLVWIFGNRAMPTVAAVPEAVVDPEPVADSQTRSA